MTTQTEIHNSVVGPIVSSIVKPPIEAGGSMADALVILESVVLGVFLLTAKGGVPQDVRDAALDNLVTSVKQRAAQLAMLDGQPAGRA